MRAYAGMGFAALTIAMVATVAVHAEKDKSIEAIEEYRQALKDGNPAELFEASGEELWKTPAGPRKASLEKCDLGLGPGVVKGAYAELPRYFADTGKVQDLESRLLSCMQTLQGVDIKEYVDAPFDTPKKNDLNALATYVSGESQGVPIKVSLVHPQERKMFNLGKRMFYYQSGPHDFACATCHSQTGLRIRLQELPDIPTKAGAGSAWSTWPAYRVSSGQMWSMQWRLADCFRQQRFPEPIYASDVTVALSMFIAATANGTLMDTPGIKR
jgi:L-cysteine S-thiosulfotransferase